MSTNRKASIAKRQRELDQKDRAKEREQRREERKTRSEARTASGVTGPEIAAPIDPLAPLPGEVPGVLSSDDNAASDD
jgi:hypothetical protein